MEEEIDSMKIRRSISRGSTFRMTAWRIENETAFSALLRVGPSDGNPRQRHDQNRDGIRERWPSVAFPN